MAAISPSRVLVLGWLLMLACDSPRQHGSATTPPSQADPAREYQPEPDSASWPSDTAAAGFITAYPTLARIGRASGVLLYPPDQAEVVDQLRSALPPGHPLRQVNESGIDDRVLVRWRTPAGSYYIVHSEGPSGDPGFYLADATTSRESEVVWGEILALPESGEYAMYQRTNTFFPKRKRVRVENGRLIEVTAERYTVGLRTVALDSLVVFASERDSTIVARIGRGDSLEVLEASDDARAGRYPIWLRTARGVRGWIALPMPQCPAAPIRGLCFLGD